jgi:hypothetical protein
MSEPGHVGEPGGVVVQTEGGDPEPVDVMRRGRDVSSERTYRQKLV